MRGTSTKGSRGGVPSENHSKDFDMKGGPKVERPECDRETVAELRFRAQMIHLGLSERTPKEETFERMRTTNLQDLDYL